MAVHRRSLAAAAVLVLGLGAPLPARADGVTLARSELPALVTPRLPLPTVAETRLFFAPAPEEVRLSRGARTALIVTAIVVGTLLLVGVVAVSRPGRL